MSDPRDPNPLAGRQARVRARLAELDLAGLLVSRLSNVRYLTGFSGSNGLLLLTHDRATFATDGRYEEQAATELPDRGIELLVAENGLLGALAERAEEGCRGERVGFEAAWLTYAEWERLGELAGSVRWTGTRDVVEELRAVKDAEEIERMTRAAEIAATALRETLPAVQAGVREADLAAELELRMRLGGASGPAFETIVASGPRTALPHAATGDRRLCEGDLLLIDFGARWQGYASDLTRTFVVGEARAEQVERYELVLAAQRAALSALRDGVKTAEVDEVVRGVFAEAGVDTCFPHSTGHGLGLEVHEGPRLSRRSEETLRSGMVVTVEPALYFSGWGGIRIEDDVIVSGGDPRSLVTLEKERLQSLPL